jgi:hypothetical protein
MPESKPIFSEEYRSGTETAIEFQEELAARIEKPIVEFEIEEELYGIAKPTRITLRARIIND